MRMQRIDHAPGHFSIRPAPPAMTPRARRERLMRFVEEKLAVLGGVTEEALARAGFPPADIAEFAPAIRARLAASGIAL